MTTFQDTLKSIANILGTTPYSEVEGNSALSKIAEVLKNADIGDNSAVGPHESDNSVEILLTVTQSFYDAVKIMAEHKKVARADIIREAISNYARGLMDFRQGLVYARCHVGENNDVRILDVFTF